MARIAFFTHETTPSPDALTLLDHEIELLPLDPATTPLTGTRSVRRSMVGRGATTSADASAAGSATSGADSGAPGPAPISSPSPISLATAADLALVDYRAAPGDARQMCARMAAAGLRRPIVALVPQEALPMLSPQWGVDDFLVETAGPLEMDARIRFILAGPDDSLVTAGPFVIDEDGYTATVGGMSLDLTYTEFELLKFLVANPGRVLSREVLLSQVWGYDYYGGTRTVDVHIRRLRAKIGPEFEGHIHTVRSVGYRFQVNR